MTQSVAVNALQFKTEVLDKTRQVKVKIRRYRLSSFVIGSHLKAMLRQFSFVVRPAGSA
jgi:hypothetical protein